MPKSNSLKDRLILICVFMVVSVGILADSKGKQLYIENCTVCHDDDGSGAMPGVSDLSETRTWLAMPTNELLLKLKEGIAKPGSAIAMPPKGGNEKLADKDMLEIISYMRKNFNK